MKRLAILGSTGSIGGQALDVVRSFPGRFEVVGLAGGRNIDLLGEQIDEFRPRLASFDPSVSKREIAGASWLHLEEIACHPVGIQLGVGISGARLHHAACDAGRDVVQAASLQIF